MTLSEKLWLGDEDLIGVLVASGISCKSCYVNKDGIGFPNCFSCDKENVFVGCPEMSVCMQWRQRKEE